MFNQDAGYRVNFARADPALLLRTVDAAVVVFGALASIVASAFRGPVPATSFNTRCREAGRQGGCKLCAARRRFRDR